MTGKTDPFDPLAGGTLQPMPLDVVSVQSQVVYGCVGNNIAFPALLAHGLKVAAVPTVMLSNTPHYATLYGGATPIEWFEGYLQALLERDALRRLRAVLVGYLGSPAQAKALAHWIERVKAAYPDVLVVIDPVIGDYEGGVYVAPGMTEAYQRHLLPLAHGMTPNGFELELLTGRSLTDAESVIAAARTLLTGDTRWVIATSAAPATWAPGEMLVAIVTRDEARIVRHPRIAAAPKGTGDLFSAELTARLLGGATVAEAAEQACDRIVRAIRHTLQEQCAELLVPRLCEE